MRRKLMVGLTVLNGFVALVLFATPADTQIIPNGIWDCCEYNGAGEGYCCEDCCWLVPNCLGDPDCRDQ